MTDPVEPAEWLTYAEMAERLGIAPESARTLAKRRRWPRRAGNDGLARIAVPLSRLNPPDDPGSDPRATPPDAPRYAPPVAPRFDPGNAPPLAPGSAPPSDPSSPLVAELRERIAGMVERVGELRAEAERERVERHQERERADQLAGQVADLAQRMAELLAEAERRRARPWWQRLVG